MIIGKASPQESLTEVLRAQLYSIDKNDLAIVYYVGHGEMIGNDLRIYPTYYIRQVNFSAVRRLIIDVLMSSFFYLEVDYCYASGGAIAVNQEIIAVLYRPAARWLTTA
jgi:hypothetical protein